MTDINEKIAFVQRKIMELGYVNTYDLDYDSFTEMRFSYNLKVDERHWFRYQIKNFEWEVELINSYQHETHGIAGLVIGNQITDSYKETEERYTMRSSCNPDEIIKVFNEKLDEVNEAEAYRGKLHSSFKVALDRLIPDILINGYLGMRFQITHTKMSRKENKKFQAETDEYRDVRNLWELKELYRSLEYLQKDGKRLTFLPNKDMLDRMKLSNTNEIIEELMSSKYFTLKNKNLRKMLKFEVVLSSDEENIYLKTRRIPE